MKKFFLFGLCFCLLSVECSFCMDGKGRPLREEVIELKEVSSREHKKRALAKKAKTEIHYPETRKSEIVKTQENLRKAGWEPVMSTVKAWRGSIADLSREGNRSKRVSNTPGQKKVDKLRLMLKDPGKERRVRELMRKHTFLKKYWHYWDKGFGGKPCPLCDENRCVGWIYEQEQCRMKIPFFSPVFSDFRNFHMALHALSTMVEDREDWRFYLVLGCKDGKCKSRGHGITVCDQCSVIRWREGEDDKDPFIFFSKIIFLEALGMGVERKIHGYFSEMFPIILRCFEAGLVDDPYGFFGGIARQQKGGCTIF